MTDPVLHEPTIMDTLDCQCIAENTSRLQAAAMMSLVDAFDRKLQRESFVTLVGAALDVHTHIGKLYMVASVYENYKIGVLDAAMLEMAVRGVTQKAKGAHADLLGLMEKIVACPTTKDKVH